MLSDYWAEVGRKPLHVFNHARGLAPGVQKFASLEFQMNLTFLKANVLPFLGVLVAGISISAHAQADAWPLNSLSSDEVSSIISTVVKTNEIDWKTLQYPIHISYDHNNVTMDGFSSLADLTVKESFNPQTQKQDLFYSLRLSAVLTRASDMSRDSIAMLACHELGHAAGGAPSFVNLGIAVPQDFKGQIAVEGQADYFASARCMKRFLQTVGVTSADAPNPIVHQKCLSAYSASKDELICEATMVAGMTLLETFNKYSSLTKGTSEPISFATPSKESQSIFGSTLEEHPSKQCRLDTFVAGALCSPNLSQVPSWSDNLAAYCGGAPASRPGCWFVK